MKSAYARHEHHWIGCDLDGTLAEHYWPAKGEFHPLVIGDPIMPMVHELKKLMADGWKVKVFTARVGPKGNSPNNKGVKLAQIDEAIFQWTQTHVGVGLEATCTKDYNMLFLFDDRAIRVLHNTGEPCCDEYKDVNGA